jgi:ribonuclease HI
MSTFECQTCGKSFAVPEKAREKYPSWQPKQCLRCHSSTTGTIGRRRPQPRRDANARTAVGTSPAAPRGVTPPERDLTLSAVLATYTEGPTTGVFTDGAAHPNPGAGGWGAVFVVENKVLTEARGSEPLTTNNRMELTALLAGYRMVPDGRPTVVMTDSRLCVDTINVWARDWERNGWKRKRGVIKNLDLVQELYRLALSRPEIELCWIKSHNGFLWNEYADALATAYRRETL